MNKHLIVTISRQFGSGGKEIGRKLAEKMHVPFYDKTSIIQISKERGITQELLTEAEERSNDSLIYSLAMKQYVSKNGDIHTLPIYDQAYSVQSHISGLYIKGISSLYSFLYPCGNSKKVGKSHRALSFVSRGFQ